MTNLAPIIAVLDAIADDMQAEAVVHAQTARVETLCEVTARRWWWIAAEHRWGWVREPRRQNFFVKRLCKFFVLW